MSDPNQPRGNFGDDEAALKEHLDMRLIVYDLMKSLNRAAERGDLIAFQSLVNRFRDSLPRYKRIEVEDEAVDYTCDDSHWEAIKIEGDTLSAEYKNPTIHNKKGTIRYNPNFRGMWYKITYNDEGEVIDAEEEYTKGGENWLSPKWVKDKEKIDYNALSVKVAEKWEELGYIFRSDTAFEEHGFTMDERKRRRTPTPIDPNKDVEILT